MIFGEATYIDVILPLPLKQKFTYQVGDEHVSSLEVGVRVAVPFGRSKIYAGLVDAIHNSKPEYEVKFVIDVLDQFPIASSTHISFWQWIADYYMCSLGEVMNSALPSSFKLANETFIVIHPHWNEDTTKLNDSEYLIMDALLLHKRLKIQEIAQILQRKTILPFVKKMQDLKLVEIEEEIR